MSVFIQEILLYGVVFLLCGIIVYFYLKGQKKTTRITQEKVAIAKEEGVYEPVSLYPYIDMNICIGSAACIQDCPEKDILGIINGKATAIKTSHCIGHGACFHACPVEAISLRIGTEKRGVDLPHVNETFETNIKGVFIAGELGGMGLIKNSVEQGKQAVENMLPAKEKKEGVKDLIVIGAGPAGISASLMARKRGFSSITLEQDSIGGTVYTFPRAKIVMTAPMDLPLYGKIKLFNTSKDELINLWTKVIKEHNLDIREGNKVEAVIPQADDTFKVKTVKGEEFLAHNVLIAIGRRGSPRKLGVPGEMSQKVAYRLLEPERISGKKIMVVGGGDSAVESAMLVMEDNEVILSYRKDKFARIKPKNREKILAAIKQGKIKAMFNSNVVEIKDQSVLIKTNDEAPEEIENDLIYIFAGGVLPTKFLQDVGIEVKRRFGYTMKKHR